MRNKLSRNIGTVGNGSGPTVLVVAGLHGNEPSGVYASQRIVKDLEKIKVNGKVIFLTGNLGALKESKRMRSVDLNRVWQTERVERDFNDGPLAELGEEAQDFNELNRTIQQILEEEESLLLLDLHTTSAQTVPFITMCDTLVNRRFIEGLGVPVVIGIEEYISGPLLSYVMERGIRSMAFESGSHADPGSEERHYHFLWLALEKEGLFELCETQRNKHLQNISFSESLSNAVFDVRHREVIAPGETKTVLPGFRNFDVVKNGQKLAQLGEVFIRSHRQCRIFMPLYQSQGSDAYFLIGRMPQWWKFLSRFSRGLRLDRFVAIAPGVSRVTERLLSVKPQTAQSNIKLLLHLVGYRFLHEAKGQMVYIRREV